MPALVPAGLMGMLAVATRATRAGRALHRPVWQLRQHSVVL